METKVVGAEQAESQSTLLESQRPATPEIQIGAHEHGGEACQCVECQKTQESANELANALFGEINEAESAKDKPGGRTTNLENTRQETKSRVDDLFNEIGNSGQANEKAHGRSADIEQTQEEASINANQAFSLGETGHGEACQCVECQKTQEGANELANALFGDIEKNERSEAPTESLVSATKQELNGDISKQSVAPEQIQAEIEAARQAEITENRPIEETANVTTHKKEETNDKNLEMTGSVAVASPEAQLSSNQLAETPDRQILDSEEKAVTREALLESLPETGLESRPRIEASESIAVPEVKRADTPEQFITSELAPVAEINNTDNAESEALEATFVAEQLESSIERAEGIIGDVEQTVESAEDINQAKLTEQISDDEALTINQIDDAEISPDPFATETEIIINHAAPEINTGEALAVPEPININRVVNATVESSYISATIKEIFPSSDHDSEKLSEAIAELFISEQGQHVESVKATLSEIEERLKQNPTQPNKLNNSSEVTTLLRRLSGELGMDQTSLIELLGINPEDQTYGQDTLDAIYGIKKLLRDEYRQEFLQKLQNAPKMTAMSVSNTSKRLGSLILQLIAQNSKQGLAVN